MEKYTSGFEVTLKYVQEYLKKGAILNNLDAAKLIFICGGSKKDTTPSERRKAVKEFIKVKFDTKIEVFYAESFIKALTELGGTKHSNLLWIEERLFSISDMVIIVLEGFGAACELGAFSNKAPYRKKLFIINDKKYDGVKSFINEGPLRAIRDDAGFLETRVTSYPMRENGKEVLDRVSDVLDHLHDLIDEMYKRKKRYGQSVVINERMNFQWGDLSQSQLFFVHDMIYLSGPISYEGLVGLFKKIFPRKKNFDLLKECIALLEASEMIKRDKSKSLTSTRTHMLLHYRSRYPYRKGLPINKMMARMKIASLKD